MTINRNEFVGSIRPGFVPSATSNTRIVNALTTTENVVNLKNLGTPTPVIGKSTGIPAWVIPIVFPSSGTSLSIRVDYLQLNMPARLRGIAISNGGTLPITAPVILPNYTFATLPACAAAIKGARAFISDGAAAPTFTAAAAGGGTLFTPVYCDGTTWRNG